jgi:uncharacterized protein
VWSDNGDQEVKLDARIDVITLAVEGLDRAVAFYRDGLGFSTNGVTGTQYLGDETTPAGATAMFELGGGLMLALYPRTELAKDAKVISGPPKIGEFSVGQLVGSREEVGAVVRQAQAAGGSIAEQPHDRPWGIYSGYFRDLDGHLWEVIWNPRSAGQA